MESASEKEMFMRSEEVHRSRNQLFIGDGDGSSCKLVAKRMPYGPLMHVEKAQCANRITKRMGSRQQKGLKTLKPIFFFSGFTLDY